MTDYTFKVNKEEGQFELHFDDNIAILKFHQLDDKLQLTHTEVPYDYRGKGVGAELVQRTLQYAKDNNLLVTPFCSYVAHFINENPEWHDVLSEGYSM